MLSVLRIKNLALAKSTRVELGPGLNVITGETGAGKSVLIGALGLLLGNRADKGLIRTGEDACGAEAQFTLHDADVLNEILAEYGIEPCEDGVLVIRRIVKSSGGGQAFVNDCPVTVQVLKKIGNHLVDIHGPHDHQSLLQPEEQLEILDSFGHSWEERENYEEQYEKVTQLRDSIKALQGDDQEMAEQIDRLAYKIQEIEDAALEEGEDEELLKEHTLLGNAQAIQDIGMMATRGLIEDEGAAFDVLVSCRQAVAGLKGMLPDAASWLEELDELTNRVQELGTDINRTVSDLDYNQERLLWLDDRITLYQQMKRKYGAEVADILDECEAAKSKLEDLQTRGAQLIAKEKELEGALGRLGKAGMELRNKRKSAAVLMSRAIQKELHSLGLKNSRFGIAFTDAPPRHSGMDSIDFVFSPNKGEHEQPLRQIASSGEMSRVMLAAKTILAAHDRIPVMVFDEIDSNVGGETAGSVGRKLSELSVNHQVICITHFPQVAVFGRTHYAVEKMEENERTHSDVRKLTEDERVQEIARMMGGDTRTTVTLEHSREMLAAARAGVGIQA